jgi:hypothetical protein
MSSSPPSDEQTEVIQKTPDFFDSTGNSIAFAALFITCCLVLVVLTLIYLNNNAHKSYEKDIDMLKAKIDISYIKHQTLTRNLKDLIIELPNITDSVKNKFK